MINKAPGHNLSNPTPTTPHGPHSHPQPAPPIRRGTAQRLGLHQPPRPGITQTRTALRFATIQAGKEALNWTNDRIGISFADIERAWRRRQP